MVKYSLGSLKMNPCKENQASGDALGPFHWAVTHGIRRVCSLDQLIARFEFRQNAGDFFLTEMNSFCSTE
jgi:hypothetical protein